MGDAETDLRDDVIDAIDEAMMDVFAEDDFVVSYRAKSAICWVFTVTMDPDAFDEAFEDEDEDE